MLFDFACCAFEFEVVFHGKRAPPARFELATFRLTAGRSTAKLRGRVEEGKETSFKAFGAGLHDSMKQRTHNVYKPVLCP